jgi:adenosylhomocysteine nucleosidase
MGKTIGVLTAMSVEYKQIASILSDTKIEKIGPHEFLKGTLGTKEIILMQCGIGKVNAASGVTNMIIHYKPDGIVSTGVAGGIDVCLRVMDVVVSTQTCYHDVSCGDDVDPGQVQGLPRFFDSSKEMVETAKALESDVRIVPGLICTGDQFITNREQLNVIKATYPEGLAVDMESAAIAQVCHLYGIPFASFRIISDTPGAEAHFEEYLNFWQTMADKSFSVTRLFLNSL